jgi:hypothetical protein
MSVKDWLTRKSEEKSARNILESLVRLVPSVRARVCVPQAEIDIIERLQAANATKPIDLDHPLFEEMMEAEARWSERRKAVVAAQKDLYANVSVWSSLTPMRAFNELILPILRSGRVVAADDPSLEALIVASYRVCEAAAKERGVALAEHVDEDVRALVDAAGDAFS